MAEDITKHITKIRTGAGDLQIDYNALANLPKIDATLNLPGAIAEAQATGDAIDSLRNSVNNGLSELQAQVDEQIQALATSTSERLAQKAETSSYAAVLTSSGWSSGLPSSQTVSVSGLLATDNPLVDVDLSGTSNYTDVIEHWKYVGRITVSDNNTLIAYCYEDKPTIDLPIILKVIR